MIRFLVMDVDGTLTDGKIYMGATGEAMKAFDVKDGCGIKEILPHYGIIPVIITARESLILQNRCAELNITELHQGVRDKMRCLKRILETHHGSMGEVAYIGDDLLDLPCIESVRNAGGLAGCPSDAISSVVDNCQFVSSNRSGEGAVRDFIEFIISEQGSFPHMNCCIDDAIDYIMSLDYEKLSQGRHEVSDGFFYNVMEYVPAMENESVYESHRKYIDIQMVVAGEEWLYKADVMKLHRATEYDTLNDVVLYRDSVQRGRMLLRPGTCVVLYPEDAHRTARRIDAPVKKIVGKLRIE